MNEEIEKKISDLIKHQFPSFYHEEGPVFVDFVRTYYEWLESKVDRKDCDCEKRNHSISVTRGSPIVTGINTVFTESYEPGILMAVVKNPEDRGGDGDYEIFRIESIESDTQLTLTSDKVPNFSQSDAKMGYIQQQSNPVYYSRRFLDITDVDKTLDEFLVHFKETYLKNIQFDTITSTKTLIKNSLDLYRSKGTERSLNLLFKIAFGVNADVYYPSKDLFSPSSGKWYIPKYIELSPKEINTIFVNKQIEGLSSGATAFCESLVRRTINGKIVDLAYISAINGNFQTGEKIITCSCQSVTAAEAPVMVGSLSEVNISTSGVGFGYSVGDIVNVESSFGRGAKARVANTTNFSGASDLTLVDGGYAYSNNIEAIVSDKVLYIANTAANAATNEYFSRGENIYQPLANINYINATANLSVGDIIQTYYANGDVDGSGEVLDITISNSVAGELYVRVNTGNLDNAFFSTVGNTITANQTTTNGYSNATVTANVVGLHPNTVIHVDTLSGTFLANEEIYQIGTSGYETGTATVLTVTSNTEILVETTNGTFERNHDIVGRTSGASANVTGVDILLGVKDINSSFIVTTNNYIYGNVNSSNGYINAVSNGSGLSITFDIINLLHSEYVDINDDYLRTYANTALNATQYSFPADPAGNLTSNTIANLLEFTNTEIGKIQYISTYNPGSGYDIEPVVVVIDNTTAGKGRREKQYISITGATSSFSDGEVITQESTSGRALILSANSSEIVAENLRINSNNDIIPTVNATTIIVGGNSGAEANVTSIVTDINSDLMGLNLEIDTAITVGNGAITSLQVTDSGFGFTNNEFVNIYGSNVSANATGIAFLSGHGEGSGFYKSRNGFLSDNQKLQDGYYWQRYSYEVRSSIALNKYEDMLKQVVHVAGTKLFSNLIYTSDASTVVKTTSSTVSVS
jgi:hypothetical protein